MGFTLQGFQTNFTAGELTPKLLGHTDINKYKNGLKTAQNVICLPHGPVAKRNGTQFLSEIKDSSNPARLLKFQFNQISAYILEMGNNYIRIYKDGIPVRTPEASLVNGDFSTGDLTGWTDISTSPSAVLYNGTPGHVGAYFNIPSGHNTAKLYQQLNGLGTIALYTLTFNYTKTMTSSTDWFYKVKIGTTLGAGDILTQDLPGAVGSSFLSTSIQFIPGANTVYLSIEVSANLNMTGGIHPLELHSVTMVQNDSIFELATEYTTDELAEISYSQFGKTSYFVHKNHTPAILSWDGLTDAGWSFKDVFFYPPATDEDGEKPAVTLTPGALTGIGATFTTSGNYFLAGDVGRQLHNLSGQPGRASITSVTNATTCVADILDDFTVSSAIPAGQWLIDLSPIAKLDIDQSSIGTTATVTSFYTDSFRGPWHAITAVSQHSPGVVTSAGHGLASGDKVEIAAIKGMTKLNATIWLAVVIDSANFSMVDSNNLAVDTTAYTPYISGGKCRKVFVDVGLDVFRATDVGRYLLLNAGIGQITNFIDAQTITVELQKELNTLADTSQWSIEDLAWTDEKGYPRTVALFQQRQWFGGTDAHTQTIYASETSVFDSLGVGANDADAMSIDISTGETNTVQWMIGLSNNLVVGTFGAELTVNSGGVAGPITSKTASLEQVGAQSGSIPQNPVVLNNEILYIQRSGNRINSFKYQFDIDNYVSNDLMFLADHMPKVRGGIISLTYAHDPDRTILCTCANGDMLAGTYYSEQQVMAWSSYSTNGVVESVETLSTGTSNDVYVLVKRDINGVTKRYLERFDHGDGTTPIDGFSDCYLSYYVPITILSITKGTTTTIQSLTHGLTTGDKIKFFGLLGDFSVLNGKTIAVTVTNINTITIAIDTSLFEDADVSSATFNKLITVVSGIDHLEGQTVQVKADGAVHADRVVVDGAITLAAPAYAVTVGLGFKMKIVTLNKEINLGAGSEQGQPGRMVKPILRLLNSTLPTLNGEFVPVRSPLDRMDNAVGLVTDDVEYGNLTWNTNTELTIENDLPLPFILLGLFGSAEFGAR